MILTNHYHSFDELVKLIWGESIEIDSEALRDVEQSFLFLQEFSKERLVYGVNTGFGPMAQYRIHDEDITQLQYNLVRSHATGTGKELTPLQVRAALICRLVSLLRGYSGVHPSTISQLQLFINHEIYPVIYQHGSVGASGDLVQLAHLALALIGEGEVIYKGGKTTTRSVLKHLQIDPLQLYIRDGLSLINGTSVMSGIALINLVQAKKLFHLAVMTSAMVNEVVSSCNDHYSIQLNNKKHHYGQRKVAGMMSEILADSQLMRERYEKDHDHLPTEEVLSRKVQEYYSLRSAPQILGPILDTINQAEKVIVDEINSSNDNPVVDYRDQTIYHGSNFHGDYISLEMDKLKIAIIRLTMLAERQLNFLMNDKLNQQFPPFLNHGKLGLNLGMQAMQFTATSTTAESQTLGFPNYVHSIPNNNDNQDIVSMGTNSALITAQVIENGFEVMAIYLIALAQAYEFIEDHSKIGSQTKEKCEQIRSLVPKFIEDTPKYEEILKVKEWIMNMNDK